MKKIYFITTLVVMLCSGQQAFSHLPIPSYNVTVDNLKNFQEFQLSKGKRDMDIKVSCGGISSHGICSATVWVYSLDGQSVLGPFMVVGGETLVVVIDEREWGVLIKTDDVITVDVWTSSSKLMKSQCSFPGTGQARIGDDSECE